MVEQGDIFIVKRIGVPRTGRFDNSSCEHPEEMCGVYFPAIKSPEHSKHLQKELDTQHTWNTKTKRHMHKILDPWAWESIVLLSLVVVLRQCLPYGALADLELTNYIWMRLSSNLWWSSCIGFPSTWITELRHHASSLLGVIVSLFPLQRCSRCCWCWAHLPSAISTLHKTHLFMTMYLGGLSEECLE